MRYTSSYARAGAEVAELADAEDSKSSARKGVGVRLPSSALCPRNRDRARVLRSRVWVSRRVGVTAAIVATLLVGSAIPASARVRVFVGGAVGLPYPYPYYYYPPYAPYPSYEVPPPGWVPGHWEWRYDPRGRRYRAWVPQHLD